MVFRREGFDDEDPFPRRGPSGPIPAPPPPPAGDIPVISDSGGAGGDNPFEFNFGVPAFEGGGLNFKFPSLPRFTAPQFQVPTAEMARQNPGYEFRLGEGERALQQSAAGRGVLRTGGTLKDILAYGQNFASNEYQNVFDRELAAFDRKYQGAKDMFAPDLLKYQLQFGAEKDRALFDANRDWQEYVFGIEQDRWMQEMLWNMFNSGAGSDPRGGPDVNSDI